MLKYRRSILSDHTMLHKSVGFHSLKLPDKIYIRVVLAQHPHNRIAYTGFYIILDSINLSCLDEGGCCMTPVNIGISNIEPFLFSSSQYNPFTRQSSNLNVWWQQDIARFHQSAVFYYVGVILVRQCKCYVLFALSLILISPNVSS